MNDGHCSFVTIIECLVTGSEGKGKSYVPVWQTHYQTGKVIKHPWRKERSKESVLEKRVVQVWWWREIANCKINRKLAKSTTTFPGALDRKIFTIEMRSCRFKEPVHHISSNRWMYSINVFFPATCFFCFHVYDALVVIERICGEKKKKHMNSLSALRKLNLNPVTVYPALTV